MTEKTSKSNITVERAFDILMVFAEDRQVVTASEVSERFGLPRSTTYRYLSTLRAYGLLEEREGGGYKLGPKVFQLARATMKSSSIVNVARPYLEELSSQTGETVSLNQTLAGEVVVVDCVESQQRLKISYVRGSAMPVPGSASAKTFLAFDPSIELDAFLAEAPMRKYTSKTIIDRDRLSRKIIEARKLGYTINDEEVDEGVRAVAAPILIGGRASYCVSLVGPSVRISSAMLKEYGEMVKRCADAISAAWQEVKV
ncbi:IclR family transcriptional regulator [Burkholderia pseudomultivorans]|nr:IclR family transcriptional regulator [Burkholderia pseudomultivorans]